MSASPAPAYRIAYPPELPVSQARDELARAIRDHQVVVVAGATGSGKTTQLPKICLELGRERIGHTQPRRIAARSIAERIASELGVDLGTVVGYQVRFDDRTRTDTAIKLMTDGVLLAELSRDRELRAYDTIIIDEAHERSLTIDFLLGYLTRLLPRRPDLKVIVTSATIDPESFARHFAAAIGAEVPVIEVSGRTYPVDIRYRPLVADAVVQDSAVVQEVSGLDGRASGKEPGNTGQPERRSAATPAQQQSPAQQQDAETDAGDVQQGIVDALAELEREEPGDVLVFLSGESEIRDAADVVRGRFPADEVVPLYGRLSAAEQHRVFDTRRSPGIRRRVVIATNVAETSITVPGIRYVVDAGTARISRYSPRAKVQRLPIEAISQASANQRSGRAGRTSPGIAIRLYSEDDFARRPEFTDPEILRTGLAAVILQMLELRLGGIREFPFLTPPDPRGIADGLDLLRELGAVRSPAVRESTHFGADSRPKPHKVRPLAEEVEITRVGRDLARLPVDPRFGRMLVEAGRQGVVREVAAIVAGLSIQDPRERPLEKRPQADAAHARFRDPGSDFVSLLNLWNHLEDQQKERSGNAFRRMCKAEYLNYLRVREWQDLYRQLMRAATSVGLRPGERSTDADAIHRSVLAGLLSRLGLRDPDKKDYLGSRGQRFVIFPGSGLAKKQPNAVMAAELVETSRLFARTVAGIDPAWAETLAGDLAKRSYSEPHWSSKQGAALVWEKVTLYGVPIVPRRRAQLARIDAPLARELFIRHALVEGDWPHELQRSALLGFDRENERLRRELAEVEERTRRRDILTGDEAVFAFYDARIPDDVTDSRRFASWWKKTKTEQPALLTMSRGDLLEDEAGDASGFPDEWVQGDATFRLRYRFEPGADDDGVTVVIPVAVLPRVPDRGFDWLVPGMREDLVTALIKALPKGIRRHVVPAGDWARRLLAELPVHSDAPVGEALTDAIRKAAHIPVTASDIEWERVPVHLRMRFEAVDARGRTLGASRELAALQGRLAERARTDVAVATARVTPGRELERTGLTSWDLDAPLPEQVSAQQAGSTVVGYPALVDETTSAAVRVFATRPEADAAHARGVRRLVALALPNPLGYVQEQLTAPEKLVLATAPYPSTKALLDDVLLAVVDELAGRSAPRDRAGFEALRDRVSGGLMDGLFAAAGLTARVLTAAKEVDRAIAGASSLAFMSPLADARSQLGALVHPGFVRMTGLAQLARVPVYLAGIRHRVEKLADNPGRDRAWQTQIEEAAALYRAAGGELPLTPATPARLVPVRWMLEELRLSLFAQHLGAAGPVSVQRIRKALGE